MAQRLRLTADIAEVFYRCDECGHDGPDLCPTLGHGGLPYRPYLSIRGHANTYWFHYYRCCPNGRSHVMAAFALSDGAETGWFYITDDGAIETVDAHRSFEGIHFDHVVGRAPCLARSKDEHIWYAWHFADECTRAVA